MKQLKELKYVKVLEPFTEQNDKTIQFRIEFYRILNLSTSTMILTMNPSTSCAFNDNFIELQSNGDI